MRAWAVQRPGPLSHHPLRSVTIPVPEPSSDEVLVEVLACGVCRTDLHLCLGELPPHRAGTVPGHQAIGAVVATGSTVSRFQVGDQVGIAWLRSTCGSCPWCRAGRENLCPDARFTGWDHDGGFAEFATVPEAFAHPIPGGYSPEKAAPLLCAGIIGYRALTRSCLPPGGVLGLWGFGSSAHITAQIALAQGAEVMVITRGESNRQLALELGASFVGDATAIPPRPVDSAIVFAPAGELVPAALASTRRGGTVALAGIYLSEIPPLNYERHLFYERDLRSVTANTRRDADELLRLAAHLDLQIHVSVRGFGQAEAAIADVAGDRGSGSTVLVRDR